MMMNEEGEDLVCFVRIKNERRNPVTLSLYCSLLFVISLLLLCLVQLGFQMFICVQPLYFTTARSFEL